MVSFSPIAIIGRACVLPGALDPRELWRLVSEGRDLVGPAPAGRWGLPHDELRCGPTDDPRDRCWSDRGGYVSGFEERWDPEGFALPAERLAGLDPLFHWVLHCAREALADAGDARRGLVDRRRVGAVYGNLGFPTESMTRQAEASWRDEEPRGAPENRFMSGGSASVLRAALGLAPGVLCLDTACASSLYAIKLACDQLHDGHVDLALAGAVNRADDLFLHVGFTALRALSQSGRSRPFHAQADGLLPAEGAAFVTLKRLDDARRDGDTIHGVIRGLGLSNDGRGRGFLAPLEGGQTRALAAAYDAAGVSPSQVGLLECHATGTRVGDATELASTGSVYEGCSDVPIASLKSNLGHLITAAGLAGLIKLLEAMHHQQRPPSLHAGAESTELQASPFRVVQTLEDWPSDGPRLAGLSAFGFGGNNAHLIVSEDDPSLTASPPRATPPVPLAVVGVGALVGSAEDTESLAATLLADERLASETGAPTAHIELAMKGLRFPPRDLQVTSPQQLALLKVAREALDGLDGTAGPRGGVFVAMEPDTEVCRYGLRWRHRARLREAGLDVALHEAWLAETNDAIVPSLSAAAVVGTMPNIPANRLNNQFDLGGASFTLSCGESSGLRALSEASRALRAGELDLALVGAVDLSCAPVHEAALERLEGASSIAGDAAVSLVLKRLSDAEAASDPILLVLDSEASPSAAPMRRLDARLGRSWAAGDLRDLVANALCLRHHCDARGEPLRSPDGEAPAIAVSEGCVLRAYGPPAPIPGLPRLHLYAGDDSESLLASLEQQREDGAGPARVAILARSAKQLAERRTAARRHILEGTPAPAGVTYRARPIDGQLAFVFGGAGSAYAGMGRALRQAFPELEAPLRLRAPAALAALDRAWPSAQGADPEQRLWASSALCQLHNALSTDLLGLTPDAVIGYSSGESNALFASGAWRDLDAMIAEASASALFREDLGGPMRAVAESWGAQVRWETWMVLAPLQRVEALIASEPRVHLTAIHGDADAIIAGDAEACGRIRSALGASRCVRLHYDLAVHVPELRAVERAWLALHRRPVTPPPNIRVYSPGAGGAYQPSTEACAQAILAQAVDTLDFRRVIEAAWNDGIRVFVEHGPQASCRRWIRSILGDRDGVVVALDRKGQSLEALLEATSELYVAGVPVDTAALLARFHHRPPPVGPSLRRAAHPSPVTLPEFPSAMPDSEVPMEIMPPAPTLAPVLDAQGSRRDEGLPRSAETRFEHPQWSPAGTRDPEPSPSSRPEPAHPTASAALVASPSSRPEPARPTASAALVASPSSQRDRALAMLTEQVRSLGLGQRAFLSEQQAIHERFLAIQGKAMDLLSRAPVAPITDPIALVKAPVGSTATPSPAALTSAPSATTASSPREARLEAQGPQQASAVVANEASPGVLDEPANPAPGSSQGRTTTDGALGAERTSGVATRVTPRAIAGPAPTKSTAAAPRVDLAPKPRGPSFDRGQLEVHASGRISEIFGDMFTRQDGFRRQVRMPEPPLLLADRITGLDASPGSMGRGTIWSETDVTADAWYLHQGHMPSGVMIEAGQADLMLISYLGVDFTNRNDRVYRLLGCELTYHGGQPRIGDTLSYDIHMDGHATQGEVRLMFFHYDCRIGGERRLSVRQGQAGFFTEQELADSDGCLWRPEDQELAPAPRLDPPARVSKKRSFNLEQLRAFADGRPWDCFGDGFARTRCHTRTPRIPNGHMMLLGPITDFDPEGGPWGRGYMCSDLALEPDSWFFDGHFKSDPCMPGTLMFEGCLQLMSVYIAANGFTVARDGWRFEPVPERPFKLSCRGQATPKSRELRTELFVEELHDGPHPTLYADLLCTVDGLKAFHARRVAIQLTPAWPLDDAPALEVETESTPSARSGTFDFDQASLLACANGRPSKAFGPIYDRFDTARQVARLPGRPYHFMSRVTKTTGEIGSMSTDMAMTVEYDVPPDAWYFEENTTRRMPFAVLLEAALQPCGWLASYLGCALESDTDMRFRNLDGDGVVHAEVTPDAGVLTTEVRSTGISRMASMIIVSFELRCRVGEQDVYSLDTVFGFFPESALADQVGLPIDDAQRATIEAPGSIDRDLRSPPARPGSRPRLAEAMLRMIDRVTAFEATGGAAGLGSARAEKRVDPGEWFFKAHFFQDPVQPGSLGIEAMVQLLQWTMLELGLDEHLEQPRFESIATEERMSWKYRGQVVPENALVTTTLELTELRRGPSEVTALADASLWVDGKRIYEATGLAMRLVSGGFIPAQRRALDPQHEPWLGDHRPTFTVPALPMMVMIDLLAQGASIADPVTIVRDVRVKRWLAFDGPRQVYTERSGEVVRLFTLDDDEGPLEVASARVITGIYSARPVPLCALEGPSMELPYARGELFHGPAFQCLEALVRTSAGASSTLRAASGVPHGRLNPGLLDAATHGIPHDRLELWGLGSGADQVAYPAFVPEMEFFGPTPSHGTLRCEVRPAGQLGSAAYPAFDVQLVGEAGVWCRFRLVEACFEKGVIGRASPLARRAFLRDHIYIEGLHTSETDEQGGSVLTEVALEGIDWLPGTVEAIYGTRDLAQVAMSEHIARAHELHPYVLPQALPLHRFDLECERHAGVVRVSGDGRGALDLTPVTSFWKDWFGRDPWLVEDLYYGLIERFVGRVVLADPEGFEAHRGRSVIYLANHQVGIESLLFSIIASALGGTPTVTLAKSEHRDSWLGELIAHCFSYPGVEDPGLIRFFDRSDKAQLPHIVAELAADMRVAGRGIMVHCEGTRSKDCGQPVTKLSGAFLDMALATGAPVVPVRFIGGLPREPVEQRLEFPVGMGRQDIYIGRPLSPEDLAPLHYGERKRRVLDAINALGPSADEEQPATPDAAFEARVAAWQARHGVTKPYAVLGCVLAERRAPTAETKALLERGAHGPAPEAPNSAWTERLRRLLYGP